MTLRKPGVGICCSQTDFVNKTVKADTVRGIVESIHGSSALLSESYHSVSKALLYRLLPESYLTPP